MNGLLQNLSYNDPCALLFEEGEMQMLSAFSGILEAKRDEILSLDHTLSLSDILVSSFYWFIKLKNAQLKKHDDTIGYFSDHSTDMLLRFYFELGDTVDWSVFEDIEKGIIC